MFDEIIEQNNLLTTFINDYILENGKEKFSEIIKSKLQISKNRYEYALSYVSILLGGMVAVPLDKDFTEIELKNALIRKSGRCNYI